MLVGGRNVQDIIRYLDIILTDNHLEDHVSKMFKPTLRASTDPAHLEHPDVQHSEHPMFFWGKSGCINIRLLVCI